MLQVGVSRCRLCSEPATGACVCVRVCVCVCVTVFWVKAERSRFTASFRYIGYLGIDLGIGTQKGAEISFLIG